MNSRKYLLALSMLACCLNANAQSDVKTTEIWLVSLKNEAGKTSCGIPERITDNDHYDNQPSFSYDGRYVYFASMIDTPQTDIMEYDIKTKKTRRITKTPESEYQPQQIPKDHKLLSVVRVNEEKAQQFYSVNYDGTEINAIAENEDSLAYYNWLNDSTVGMYILYGEAPMLLQFDIGIQQSIQIMDGGSFGRCLQKIPGTADLSFIVKREKGESPIYKFGFEDTDTTFICNAIPGEEDFSWAPNGEILMGSKGKLYILDTKKKDNTKWEMIADFTKTIGNFYRLAVSPTGDKIAIVSYTGAKP